MPQTFGRISRIWAQAASSEQSCLARLQLRAALEGPGVKNPGKKSGVVINTLEIFPTLRPNDGDILEKQFVLLTTLMGIYTKYEFCVVRHNILSQNTKSKACFFTNSVVRHKIRVSCCM
jgi:hypothetical protein